MNYIVYFDSGTTNSRIYLLDEGFDILYTDRIGVGSRDSSIAGSNRVLIEGLYGLYERLLAACGLCDADISGIFLSGMVTSPYGIKEVAHIPLPLSVEEFAGHICRCREDSAFHRDLYLVPGIKTLGDDFSLVGNMRGEEIEIIGALDEIREQGVANAAFVMPGSHTHVTYVEGNVIRDIISNFTGELFYALRKETILAPVLSVEVGPEELDEEMILLAMDNLDKFGFPRALYICHAMRILGEGTSAQRFSYGEGVVCGGLRRVVDYYLERRWTDCEALVIVADELMYRLLSVIFRDSRFVRRIIRLPLGENTSYGVKGLAKILGPGGETHD